MRILSITAGAAGMYCGSCARDNALARELISRGHDVTLVPVYTPTRTDEPNVSRPRVLFGGVSVYLQQHVPLFRKTPALLDRIWDSPRVINLLAGRAVSNDPQLLGEMTISMLSGEKGVLGKEFEKLVGWVRSQPLPEVINLPNSLLIALAAPLKKVFQRPICCTLQGEELFIEGLEAGYRQRALDLIRQQVSHVDRFIAVSRYAARFMSDYLEIPPEKVSVVPLGINMEGYTRRSEGIEHATFRVGYFARIAPEKGLDALVEAYIRFRRRTAETPAMLEVAGYTAPMYQGYLKGVRTKLVHNGLVEEYRHHGVVDRAGKLAFLRNLDVLSVPASYDEPKGLFLIEAMAMGVPVVQPRRGAFIEIVETTGGGLLVEPGNPEALAEGLVRLCRDRAQRKALADRAFDGARQHYTVESSAARLLEVYDGLLHDYRPVGQLARSVGNK